MRAWPVGWRQQVQPMAEEVGEPVCQPYSRIRVEVGVGVKLKRLPDEQAGTRCGGRDEGCEDRE